MVIKAIFLLLLSSFALAQTPQNLVVDMNEQGMPEITARAWFEDVPGASYYNEYRAFNAGGTLASCPDSSSAKLIGSTTENYFDDDPAPGLYEIGATGNWRSKIWWCYYVSSVIVAEDGTTTESALSNPAAVAVGDTFYITLRYQTACTGNIQVVEPFPYLNGQITAQFYYTDYSGVDHEFAAESLYNSFGQPAPYNEEWESHLPIVALDNTIVPWTASGKYRAVIKTPDGGNYTINLGFPYNNDAAYYQNFVIERVKGGPDCAVPYNVLGFNTAWWQNVLR